KLDLNDRCEECTECKSAVMYNFLVEVAAIAILAVLSQASDLGSIPTAPTINRVDSVALALSSADSGPEKAGVLVQSWSKPRPNKEKADSLRAGLFLSD